MDISFYYEILDTGIFYEKRGKKGKKRKKGKWWKIGERKRLREEIIFWQNLLEYISNEENGIECSEALFENLKGLCKKYKFPNYERIYNKKDELINSDYKFIIKKEEELQIRNLMKQLLLDLQKNVEEYKDKEKVYRILRVLYDLPKPTYLPETMYGQNILISCNDAIKYAKWSMDDDMKEYNYSDIVQVDKTGILFSDGQRIDFEECRSQWAEEHGISVQETVCVASRFPDEDEDDIYFMFHSKEMVKVYFRVKGIFRKKRKFDKFHELQILLNRYGYHTFDMS